MTDPDPDPAVTIANEVHDAELKRQRAEFYEALLAEARNESTDQTETTD